MSPIHPTSFERSNTALAPTWNYGGAAAWRPSSASLPPSLSTPPSSFAAIKAIQRRWLLVGGLGVLAAVITAFAAWLLIPPRYTAVAMVHVAANQPWKVFPTPDSRQDFFAALQTQAAQIKSRYVLQAALNFDDVKALDLYGSEADPVLWLLDEIKVEAKEGSEIITISMSGPKPEELITIVNAVQKAYLNEVESIERKKRMDRVRELDALYLSSRDKLRNSRETWLRVANQLGSSDSKTLTQKQLLLLGTYNKLKDQHLHAAYDLKKAQTRLAALEARPQPNSDEPLPEAMLTQALAQDPAAVQARTRLTQLEQILADYDRNAVRGREETGARQALKDVDTTRQALQARHEELRRELTPQYRQQLLEQREAEINEQRHDLQPLTEQEKWLRDEVERLEQEACKIGNTHTELDMLREDIKHDEQLGEKITQQLDTSRLELNSPMRVTSQQEAAIQKQDKKRQLIVLFLAPIAGFACVAMSVVWLESRSKKIQSVQEVVADLGMRVMGAVPALPNDTRRGLIQSIERPDIYGTGYLESIDAVRTLLLRDAHLDGTKVVMVTSAVEGEGKTTLASHLAGSLARAGRRTLLIDCDLRRPTLQQVFDLPLQPGFGEALRGDVSAAEVVQETDVENLFIITAGQWDRDVMQTLAKHGAQRLLQEMRSEYDFVVIDSHPVLAATDSLLVGQDADAVILSLLRDRSQSHVVNAACQRLSSLGIRILGAVVNGIEPNELYGGNYSYPSRTLS